jgi:hypothetical protein
MSGFIGQAGGESLGNLHCLLHEALKADIVIINRHLGSDLGIQPLAVGSEQRHLVPSTRGR